MGADVSAFSPLVPLPFQPQSVRAARLQGSAECGFWVFLVLCRYPWGFFSLSLSAGSRSPQSLCFFGDLALYCSAVPAPKHSLLPGLLIKISALRLIFLSKEFSVHCGDVTFPAGWFAGF